MREELTEENLKKYGFSDEHVKYLLGSEHCTVRIENDSGFYSASSDSREIISGTEAKYFSIDGEYPFPYDDIDLIESYYMRKQLAYLESEKIETRSHYNESIAVARFKELEIKETEELIETLKAKPKAMQLPSIQIKRLITYLDWLRTYKGNTLTAYEIALQHHYLVKYNKEKWIEPVEVGKKYHHLRNAKNIEDHYRDFDNNRNRPPKIKELEKIEDFIAGYPDIQKAVINDIDKLR